MKLESKFNIGDTVWFAVDRPIRICKAKIKKFEGFTSNGSFRWRLDKTLTFQTMDKPFKSEVLLPEKDLFNTKEDLINSLIC